MVLLFSQTFSFNIALPLSEPQFPDEDSDLLVATDDMTNGDNVELRCVRDGLRDGERVKWFRNGVELNRNNGLSVKKDDMGSGFYCCEVYSSNSTKTDLIIFDTRCVTLVFRSKSYISVCFNPYFNYCVNKGNLAVCIWH